MFDRILDTPLKTIYSYQEKRPILKVLNRIYHALFTQYSYFFKGLVSIGQPQSFLSHKALTWTIDGNSDTEEYFMPTVNDVVLVSLLLTLNRFHTFEQVNAGGVFSRKLSQL